MYKTKQLTETDLHAKLEKHKLADRPELARLIMSGVTTFTAGGDTFALRGSVAANREPEPEPAVAATPIVTKSDDDEPVRREHESRADFQAREARWIRREPAQTPSYARPTAVPIERTSVPAPKTKARPAIARALGDLPATLPPATTPLEAQRSTHRARSIGVIQGKRPSSKMIAYFEGTEPPKGAA